MQAKAYATAIAALVAAVLLRWALDPLIGDSLPLVTLFGAVAIAVWVGGYRPAIVVSVLGYLACNFLFIAPRHTIGPFDAATVVGLIAYVFTCSLIIAIGEAMRIARARASERSELMRVTLGSIGDAVVATDTEARITYANSVAESLTGWSQADALGQPLDRVFRIVDEQTRQSLENPATRALREDATVGLANHSVLIGRDGVERPIDDAAAPIKDGRGKVSGCVLIFRDISERRRLEQDAASRMRSARLLASIVESSDDAIVSKSLEGIIESWNAGAERIFGYTAEDAVGRHISLVIPPDRLTEEDAIIARLKAGQRVEHFVTERVRSDGRRILVSLTISPLKDEDGNVIGASKIARDVTRRRELEEREKHLLAEAAAANAKFRAFFDQGASLAGMLDLDGTILALNRLFVEGCGYARDEVLGKRFWEGPWWIPSAALAERVRTACARAKSGETIRGELSYFTADGSERFVDLAIAPIKDDSGRILLLAPTGTDVTDRKRAEAERKRLEDDLRKLANDLSEADRRKDEFLATLSHELRNPLAPLRNTLEILKRGSEDPKHVPQALETMERQLEHLVRLVDDLLDLNRITHSRIELRRECVELTSLIDQVVAATRPLAESSKHELRLVAAAEPIYVHADPVRLSQIFGNLLNNSCKYTSPGGMIDVRVERRDDEAVVTIEDNGIGIPPDMLDSIFDMFNRVGQPLARSQGGLGIGLALVKQLVEMHGGSVRAASAGADRGSEFVVRLPITTEDAAAAPSERVIAPEATLAQRILVVDDNRDAATSLATLLQITGHETFIAHDGPTALEEIERLRPDAVLLDIGLPRVNGYEVCRRVREKSWGNDVALIALTGWGQEEDRRTSNAAGFDGHLVKPVEYATLVATLETLVAARKGAVRT
ncbi:MAG TPA: PAS domain S-box protein [Casimicrobiaceae bacterium]|nr:PAS domain S-box protein [Casimicrobiaceae bacterium]